MISEVVMPQMGADMTEGTVLRWLKHEGDDVARNEIIAEIETDKANVEIEAFGSGVLRKIVVGEGGQVPVGNLIGVIAEPSDDISNLAASTPSPGSEDRAGRGRRRGREGGLAQALEVRGCQRLVREHHHPAGAGLARGLDLLHHAADVRPLETDPSSANLHLIGAHQAGQRSRNARQDGRIGGLLGALDDVPLAENFVGC